MYVSLKLATWQFQSHEHIMNGRNCDSFTIRHILFPQNCKLIFCTLRNFSQFERNPTFEGDKKQMLGRKHLAPKM
jgi:hypothetical protein